MLWHFYTPFRTIWTGYGFRDALNLRTNWWDSDAIGIGQGPILIMAENHRWQKVWQVFAQNLNLDGDGVERGEDEPMNQARCSNQKAPRGGAPSCSILTMQAMPRSLKSNFLSESEGGISAAATQQERQRQDAQAQENECRGFGNDADILPLCRQVIGR